MQTSRHSSTNIATKIANAEQLFTQLLILSNFPTPKEITSLSMSKDFRPIQRLVSSGFEMIIPLQRSLTVSLPINNNNSNNYQMSHHPFPQDLPTITGRSF